MRVLTPTPWLTGIHREYHRYNSKGSHSSLIMYYETEIPSLTPIPLRFVVTDFTKLAFPCFSLTQLFSRTKSKVNQGIGVHIKCESVNFILV